MDPFTHTMVGATLAQTGLAKRTRYGAAALVVGANLPDIDAFTQFLGTDTALYLRRGWTHGILALFVLPLVLTGTLIRIAHLRRASGPPPLPKTLFVLSLLAVAFHLPLDWINTYGIRWLMPFNGRWFYGDAVLIVDPWIWLVLGGTVFLRHSTTRKGQIAWTVVAGLSTAGIFLATPSRLLPAKILWLIGVGALIGLRYRRLLERDTRARRFAAAALVVTTVYIGLMIGTSLYARSFVLEETARRDILTQTLMVGPVPVTPFVRDVVVETPHAYRYGTLELLPRPRLELESRVIPKPAPTPLVTRALQSPDIVGFMNWVRFPFVEIEENENDYIVHVLDARYMRERTVGFGATRIVLPKSKLGVVSILVQPVLQQVHDGIESSLE
jgi:inner membrane protein